MDRTAALTHWLEKQLPGRAFILAPASSDASFRRYLRARFADDGSTRIVMDAPPEHEDCKPFIRVAGLFGAAGVHVPEVLAQDLEQGFLLLSDLGDTTYLAAIQQDLKRADALYRDAFGALVRIQAASRPGELPPYDRALLLREMQLLPDWYIARHKQLTLDEKRRAVLDAAFETLLENNLAQPQVYVHRDYHSRNLMVGAPGEPGILDFQDAVYGPITYDLASLLKDAYIEWEEEQVLDWCIRYWEAARKAALPVQAEFGDFYRDFEWMGLQRHLKVLGIFARLNYRDGKANYLNDIPLVMRYARRTCARYAVFFPLLRLLEAVENIETKAGYTF
ncbi:MAG: aminoglycoside phosphotransferase [Betaproteobacteria bacterium]|nr:aminoglycoside phosphotransferase [Betaproteobacteria bacterium]